MRRDHSPAAGVRKGGQRQHHDDGMALVLAMVLAALLAVVVKGSHQSSIHVKINDLLEK